MRTDAKLTDAHIGRFVLIWKDCERIPAKIVSIDPIRKRISWERLDGLGIQSAGYDPDQVGRMFDTAEEVLSWKQELEDKDRK